jgi:hypothetical protein
VSVAGREIVQADDALSALQQTLEQRGADEARHARDKPDTPAPVSYEVQSWNDLSFVFRVPLVNSNFNGLDACCEFPVPEIGIDLHKAGLQENRLPGNADTSSRCTATGKS